MSQQAEVPPFTNEAIAYVLTILRNATSPLTTADLVAALKKQSSR